MNDSHACPYCETLMKRRLGSLECPGCGHLEVAADFKHQHDRPNWGIKVEAPIGRTLGSPKVERGTRSRRLP